VAGDSLSGIARQSYGSAAVTEGLYAANRDVIGASPDLLAPGMVLALPCIDAEVAAATDGVADTGADEPPPGWQVVMPPARAAALLADDALQPLDIRDGARDAYLPGSLSIPYPLWRGGDGVPGRPASDADLSARIGAAGLRLAQPILIVHDRHDEMSTGAAAYVYWVLKSAGARQVAILDGGAEGWAAAGLPADPAPATPRPYAAGIRLAADWRATAGDVAAISAGRQKGTLLDARPASVFRRLDKAGLVLPSTIAGAQNLPNPVLFGVVRDRFDAMGMLSFLKETEVNWEEAPVVTFCQTGELAALSWLYASEVAGITDVRLYPESTQGWTAEGGVLSPPEGATGGG
jgi:thiosulfate/3-mercaptopyruvate sulfurtransferase